MNITFTSLITQDGKENTIAFTSPVTVTDYEGFKVYEFTEPSQGILNRIEVSPMAVNIFAGPSSINLELDKETQVTYETPAGPLYIAAHMSECNAHDTKPNWTYTLKSGDQLVGEYKLSLEVK